MAVGGRARLHTYPKMKTHGKFCSLRFTPFGRYQQIFPQKLPTVTFQDQFALMDQAKATNIAIMTCFNPATVLRLLSINLDFRHTSAKQSISQEGCRIRIFQCQRGMGRSRTKRFGKHR